MKRKPQKPAPTRKRESNITRLSIVIPCYNESARISIMEKGLNEFLSKWDKPFELIVVNDGSKDDTAEKIRQSAIYKKYHADGAFILIDQEVNRGKGAAIKAGVAQASGSHILTLDADMSASPTEVIQWVNTHPAIADNEILIGSRPHKSSKIKDKPMRKTAGKIFNFIVRMLTPINAKDTQCGFKLYPAAVAKQLFGQMKVNGWAHDVEILYSAHLDGTRIKEMPLHWEAVDNSKVSLLKDSLKMLWQVLMISGRMRFDYLIAGPVKTLTGKNKSSLEPASSQLFRLMFTLVAVLLFFLMPFLSKDYGISSDEWIQSDYGHQVYDYFTKGDSRAVEFENQKKGYETIIYYSGGFEFISTVVYKLFGTHEFNTRHFLNALFGFLAILFAGLTGRRLGGWRAGFFTLVVLALTPRFFGHAMNNPKDIPFAAGYIFTIYFLIRMVMELPRPQLRTMIWVAFGIAWTINIRVGGLILIGYLFAFLGFEVLFNKSLRSSLKQFFAKYVKYALLIAAAGYLGGLIFWPYALQDPLSHPLKAMEVMSNYVTNIRILFDGEHIMSNQVPWYYIPHWLYISSPVLLLAGAVIACLLIPLFNMKLSAYKPRLLLLLAFTIIFPVFYAVYKNSNLYDGMRHFLFIIPSIAIASGLGWDALGKILPGKPGLWATYLVFALLAFIPLKWMIANHPNQVVYFSELAGGIDGAYGKYETDYYMNSVKEATKWLYNNEGFASKSETVLVGTNASFPVRKYMEDLEANIKNPYTSYANRASRDWDYGIFISRYVDKEQLLKYWPPQHTIHTVKADNTPICAVVKRPSKDDLLGTQAFSEGNYAKAIDHFTEYIALDTTNEMVYAQLGAAYLNSNEIESAAIAFEHAIRINPSDIQSRNNLGVAYVNTGRGNKAIALFNEMLATQLEDVRKYEKTFKKDQQNQDAYYRLAQSYAILGQTYHYLGVAYKATGNTDAAITNLTQALSYSQQNQRQIYLELAGIYQEMGNMNKAQEYITRAQQSK